MTALDVVNFHDLAASLAVCVLFALGYLAGVHE